jgi:pyruvate/2-oxoglutarate dehydrogenase complex dihydrolipoamide acyltransferase (E2) component
MSFTVAAAIPVLRALGRTVTSRNPLLGTNQERHPMSDIRVPDDLWATSMMPEGLLERWIVPDGASVPAGAPLAAVRVEDALHELVSPAAGLVRRIVPAGQMIEPGCVIAQLDLRSHVASSDDERKPVMSTSDVTPLSEGETATIGAVEAMIDVIQKAGIVSNAALDQAFASRRNAYMAREMPKAAAMMNIFRTFACDPDRAAERERMYHAAKATEGSS